MALRGPLQFDRVGSRLWPLFFAPSKFALVPRAENAAQENELSDVVRIVVGCE